MQHDLRVDSDVTGDSVVVRIDGEIDVGTVDTLEKRLRDVLMQTPMPQTVTLDLAAVRFFGTVGLSLLLWADQQCREQHVELLLAAPSHAVLRPMEMTGLTSRFRIVPASPDAPETPTGCEHNID